MQMVSRRLSQRRVAFVVLPAVLLMFGVVLTATAHGCAPDQDEPIYVSGTSLIRASAETDCNDEHAWDTHTTKLVRVKDFAPDPIWAHTDDDAPGSLGTGHFKALATDCDESGSFVMQTWAQFFPGDGHGGYGPYEKNSSSSMSCM